MQLPWQACLLIQARTQGGSGGSEEPSRTATRSAQPNKIFFFLNFCVLFVSGPCCNHSVFTARMHKIAGFCSIFPKFSRGSMLRTPYKSLGFAQAHFGPPENKKNPPVWTLAYGHVISSTALSSQASFLHSIYIYIYIYIYI